MKSFIIFLLVIAGFYGCSSNSSKTTEDKSKMEVGVQNVNGNIPDTTNAINLSTQKKDSSVSRDSSK